MTHPTNEERRAAAALRDERGAIMVIGLLMALAAIAAMWSVIGIGDAIVFRDRTQEAADSAAFTNAVIHARGMNFIALVNIVLMAMCIVYVVMAFIDFMLSLVLGITGVREDFMWCAARYVSWAVDVDVQWCEVAGKVQKVENPLYKINERYFKLFKSVAKPGFEAQVVAATLVPWLGARASIDNGSVYERDALSYSLSLVPGGGAPPPLNVLQKLLDHVHLEHDAVIQDRRIGLPVEAEPAWALCSRSAPLAFQVGEHALEGVAPANIELEKWLEAQPWATLLETAFASVGEEIKLLFCLQEDRQFPKLQQLRFGFEAEVAIRFGIREALEIGMGKWWVKDNTQRKFYLEGDEFWEQSARENGGKQPTVIFSGPKRVSHYAFNGNDWMQIWSVAFAAERPEKAGTNVSLPSRIFGRSPESKDEGGLKAFWARAEFYFECESVWRSAMCNEGGMALYQMNWRARLRRIHDLDLLGDALGLVFDDAISGSVAEKGVDHVLEKVIKNGAIRGGLNESLRMLGTKLANHNALTTGDHSNHEMLH